MRWMLVLLAIALVGKSAIADNLIQGVKTEKPAYILGEKIVCQFSIHNSGSQIITYEFPSARQFDLWVTRGDEIDIFRLSKDKAYSPTATAITLCADETKTFCAEWNQKDLKGNPVGPGTYIICAQLTPSKTAPPSTSCKVVLGGKGAALAPISIKQAISLADSAPKSRISITATYRGWSAIPNDPNTKDGPPVTRSDWAICDDTGCMYVVGAVDLDPSKDIGTKVTVVGKLKKNAKGQVYIVLENAVVHKK